MIWDRPVAQVFPFAVVSGCFTLYLLAPLFHIAGPVIFVAFCVLRSIFVEHARCSLAKLVCCIPNGLAQSHGVYPMLNIQVKHKYAAVSICFVGRPQLSIAFPFTSL